MGALERLYFHFHLPSFLPSASPIHISPSLRIPCYHFIPLPLSLFVPFLPISNCTNSNIPFSSSFPPPLSSFIPFPSPFLFSPSFPSSFTSSPRPSPPSSFPSSHCAFSSSFHLPSLFPSPSPLQIG